MASWIHLKCAEVMGNHPDIITKQYDHKIIFTNIIYSSMYGDE